MERTFALHPQDSWRGDKGSKPPVIGQLQTFVNSIFCRLLTIQRPHPPITRTFHRSLDPIKDIKPIGALSSYNCNGNPRKDKGLTARHLSKPHSSKGLQIPIYCLWNFQHLCYSPLSEAIRILQEILVLLEESPRTQASFMKPQAVILDS